MLVANDEFYESIDNSQQDEYDIVLKASKGDKIALEYIIKKYKNFVKAQAKSYFLIGADKEDIIQEGMIGLYKAVRDFDASKTNSFKGFAEYNPHCHWHTCVLHIRPPDKFLMNNTLSPKVTFVQSSMVTL